MFFALFTERKKSVRVTGHVSALLGGHVSSSTLSARQMARAGVAAHSSSVATGVAYDVEYFEYHDVRRAYQWDPDPPGYAWFFVDKGDGRWRCPAWRPPWEFLLERGRLCVHAAQVPAVFRVRLRASDSVHRQSACYFSFATRDRYAQCQTVQGTVRSGTRWWRICCWRSSGCWTLRSPSRLSTCP